jgi:iron complex transport system ATP-binding protein
MILKSIDLDVKNGLFVALIGPNGSGKSTLLKCLAKILKPVKGAILIGELDVTELHELDVARLRSTVLSDRVYPFNMTVRELITLGRYPYQGLLGKLTIDDKKLIADSATMMEVEHLLESKFSELSDGQKQRVLIARALAQVPKVLILDEPATHLDAKSRVEILLKLKELARTQNIAIIASMHEIELTYRIADYVIVLEDGAIRGIGSPEEIFQDSLMDNVYGIKMASWSNTFGALELRCGDLSKRYTHIVSGAGTGIPIFRLLARKGYPFSTGILQENDLDFHLAKTMNAKTYSVPSFEPIPSCMVSNVIPDLSETRILIDSGFPIGKHNLQNLELIKNLSNHNNVTIFSIRDSEEILNIYGKDMKVENGSINDIAIFLESK